MPAAGQRRAQSRIPTQRPRAIPTAQLKRAPRLRLALNQLGGSQPATPATPEKKQQALLTNERYLYTLVMNSNAAKAAALPNGQGCRLSLRLII
jgi:hypothetical protein